MMDEQKKINYSRIAETIEFIQQNFKDQPDLNEIAEKANVSPFHFQRLFKDWVGTTPKKFLQYISIEHAKKILKETSTTLADATYETGLSSSSRLHDLFIKIEGMTPSEYKNGGKNLTISYNFIESPFGQLIVASTSKGICLIHFCEDELNGFSILKENFPNAIFNQKTDIFQQQAAQLFESDWTDLKGIKLHIKGTDFQLKVWEALLKIPLGKLCTYGTIASEIGQKSASRAVGTAIGKNPVAFLIPCHRVIQSTGNFGGYMWGNTRKTAIIGWEGVTSKMG